VYAGAIMVHYSLFVIESRKGCARLSFGPSTRQRALSIGTLLLLGCVLLGQAPMPVNGLHGTFNNQLATKRAAFHLLSLHAIRVPVRGTTLLAMVGAVALGKRERTGDGNPWLMLYSF